jgi:hypothetical protein
MTVVSGFLAPLLIEPAGKRLVDLFREYGDDPGREGLETEIRAVQAQFGKANTIDLVVILIALGFMAAAPFL